MNAPLDSRQLRAFATLARTGSFTQAAKELFLSQSAVSHSMKALEEDVGCLLLDRVGKKILLNQAGEQFLRHAEKILGEMSNARNSLKELGKWGKGRLRIGASATACQHILPTVFGEFKKRYPESSITIEPGDTGRAIELLEGNQIDLALALEPESEAQIDFHPLFFDELYFLVAPAHSWAIHRHVVREEIAREKYILYDKGSYTFRLIQDYFREENAELNTCIELGNMEAIKELVKLNLGISILAPWIARHELVDGTLRALPLGRRKLKRYWGILVLKGRRLGLPEETFINLCRDFTEKNLSSPPIPEPATKDSPQMDYKNL